jgi:hypothetical protein
MFTRLLNKQFALNINKSAYEKLIYLSSKFFLINLLQLDKNADMVNNYAMKETKDINKMTISRVEDTLVGNADGDPYKDMAVFINALARTGHLITGGFNKLTVRDYTADFIRMYGNSALFGLEHLSYFIFNIVSTLNGAFLNNQYAFKDILGKSGSDLYGYICSVAKDY